MIFGYLFLGVLAAIGLFSLVKFTFLKLFKMKNNYFRNYILLCINDKNDGDIGIEANMSFSRISWLVNRDYDGVIVADFGLSEEKRDICKNKCKKYGFDFVSLEEKSGQNIKWMKK